MLFRSVPEKWCTVTVTDNQGRRHSLDLQAASTFDAAHIYLWHLKEHPEKGLPRPTLATVFEIVIDAKVYLVKGRALQQWIVDSYLLTLGALILLAGSISDMFGRVPVLRGGLVAFGAGSVLAAAASAGRPATSRAATRGEADGAKQGINFTPSARTVSEKTAVARL